MRKNSYFLGIIISVLILIATISLVIAAHTITVVSGGTAVNTTEDVGYLYNISIENTGVARETNITQVNVTFPSSFTFFANSNKTDAGTHTFVNTSTTLSWENDGLVMNLTTNYFEFNLTAQNPGTFNITFITTNSTTETTIHYTNISVSVNDTTVPSSVQFASPTESNGSSLSQTYLVANVTVTDNGVTDKIIIFLHNSTGNVINSTNSSGGATELYTNFTGLSQGTYYINASVNDTGNNFNVSEKRTYILDTVNPTITFSCTPTEVDQYGTVTCTCSATDAVDSSPTISYTASPSTSSSGSQSTTCTVTDDAGNAATSTVSYTVNAVSSGGSGISGRSFYSNTFIQDTSDFSEIGPITRELRQKERIRIKIANQEHNIGVIRVTPTTVTINVSSIPQQETLSIGDEKKFEVTGDEYYDIYVKLNSIDAATNKANLTVKSIYELMPEEERPITEQIAEEAKTLFQNIWFWIILIIVIVVVVAVIIRKRKQ